MTRSGSPLLEPRRAESAAQPRKSCSDSVLKRGEGGGRARKGRREGGGSLDLHLVKVEVDAWHSRPLNHQPTERKARISQQRRNPR